MKNIYSKDERTFTKSDFNALVFEASQRDLLLVIDDNIDGVMTFGNFTKNLLTRRIKSRDEVTCFFIRKDFLPLREKIVESIKITIQ